jgi:predicted RNA-binding Zn-ribbon protein involved in translation (DUF1610 family)
MEASAVSAEARTRANELYWASDRSVNQIADDLDLSKGALYTIIEPLAAGLGCPMCGSEVVYPNRTAKERSLVDCPACEWDGGADEGVAESGDPAPKRMAAGPTRSAGERRPAARPGTEPSTAPSLPSGDVRAIAGGALLGAAAGLALVLWARRR